MSYDLPVILRSGVLVLTSGDTERHSDWIKERMNKMLSGLTLILGGANSGKSVYAEGICVQSGLARLYIATAQAFDDEMKDKIARHRAQRGPIGRPLRRLTTLLTR